MENFQLEMKIEGLEEKIKFLTEQISNVTKSSPLENKEPEKLNFDKEISKKMSTISDDFSKKLQDVKKSIENEIKEEISKDTQKISENITLINTKINTLQSRPNKPVEVIKKSEEISHNSQKISKIEDTVASLNSHIIQLQNDCVKISEEISSSPKSMEKTCSNDIPESVLISIRETSKKIDSLEQQMNANKKKTSNDIEFVTWDALNDWKKDNIPPKRLYKRDKGGTNMLGCCMIMLMFVLVIGVLTINIAFFVMDQNGFDVDAFLSWLSLKWNVLFQNVKK